MTSQSLSDLMQGEPGNKVKLPLNPCCLVDIYLKFDTAHSNIIAQRVKNLVMNNQERMYITLN